MPYLIAKFWVPRQCLLLVKFLEKLRLNQSLMIVQCL